MQPLFEAVSNSIHATQAKFHDEVSTKGRVEITINTDRKKENIWATVEDNGVGLDERNWEAFTTTDTDNKIEIGGKGVGRLLWLDCFSGIEVTSVYKTSKSTLRRSFKFVLSQNEQIEDLRNVEIEENLPTSFFVRFSNPRDNGYLDKFPGRGNIAKQHFISHFLPTFIGGHCPIITLNVGGETHQYPRDIDEIVHRKSSDIALETQDYGVLHLTLMECDKVASADLQGCNFVHFIAHDRTVHSHCIDGKLGLKNFGEGENRVFHAILTGEFLDKNVNQERTDFLFEDAVIEKILNDVCAQHIEEFLETPLALLRNKQREKIEAITESYPSVSFGTTEELQKKIPSGELVSDAIYGHLARERFRRDQRQAEKIKAVLARLKDSAVMAGDYKAALKEAGAAIEDAERRSLAEYVVRRKVVLDFIQILLQKVRDDQRDSSYQREDILHSFICPMRIETLTDGSSKVEPAASHDLWIVDERLTFAKYFSSDVSFESLSAAASSEDRADVLIFDYVHGLRQKEDSSKILIVEFKRPGRTDYSADENPREQIERYIKQLQSGAICDVKGRPVRVDQNTIFYCFIVADIIGKIADWTYTWRKTVDGRGRIYRPEDGFNGSIELVGWDDLLADAKSRNQAFFDAAGISGKSFFSDD